MNIGPGITIGGGITVSDSMATSSSPFTTNLVLSLDAATYSGSGAWIDSVGSKSFTLFNSPTWSSSIGGGSFNFATASSQYAECSTSLTNMFNWTVEVWHYYDGTNSGGLPCIVTEVYPGVTGAINYTLGNATSSAMQIAYFNGSWKTAQGWTFTPGNWYQIVGTYDGSTLKMYFNGGPTAVGFNTGGTSSFSSQGGIRLMRRWDLANYWGGKLGIVRIYNADIGTTGIAQNWNANRARFGI
jgi:hypothetical protein